MSGAKISKTSQVMILFIFIVIYSSLSSPISAATEPKDLHKFKLDCEPGEQRHFNYESSTKVWGSASQQVRLRASLKLRCMRPLDDGSLKYLAEVLTINADFNQPAGKDALAPSNKSSSARSLLLKNRWQQMNSAARSAAILQRQDSGSAPSSVTQLRAEPVFEEIGEAATRVRRSVSGWFNKTWTSVKDFFTNIFQSSEKSDVNREQAFKESGLDIGQCKAPGGGGKHNGIGLPIDDSVFDDLEPKYYIGASSSPDGMVTAYEFGDDLTSDFGEDEQISFFDDPKLNSQKGGARTKRGAGGKSAQGASWPLGRADKLAEHERLLKLPFVFVQSRSGRVLEVRFGVDETDLSVKNFKRHLCDLFATNLDGGNQSQAQEVSPIGQHTTKYILDQSLDAKGIKESLMNSDKLQQDNKQLVRALSVVGGNKQQIELTDDDDAEGGADGEGRSHGDRLSVLRSINSTNSLRNNQQLSNNVVVTSNGPALMGDIDRVEVRVKQVQQISDGRMVGSAGHLAMSLVSTAPPNSGGRQKRSTDAVNEETADIADLLQVSTSFTVQLVPVTKFGNFESVEKNVIQKSSSDELPELTRVRRHLESNNDTLTSAKQNQTVTSGNIGRKMKGKRDPLVLRATNDTKQLEKTLDDWRKLELRLELKSSNLTSESGGRLGGRIERLDVLRDQIQMRLNEEFMRNRLRQARGPQPVAANLATAKVNTEDSNSKDLLGLSLTQLILDTGISSKRKGSVYLGLEEALDLEWELAEQSDTNSFDSSVGRLLRETVRLDKLRSHCKSSIASLSDLRASQVSRLELKSPFGVANDDQDKGPAISAQLTASGNGLARSRRKFEQCKQVLYLLLRAGERQAPETVVDLIDTCNSRLLAASKVEELGHGPASRYYRNLRQQFTELLSQVRKPTESLLDKLATRLSFKAPLTVEPRGRSGSTAAPPEFTYVSSTQTSNGGAPAYNQSQLIDEDDLNNNDGAGSLVMTIASLASRPSVKRPKRVKMIEKLLAPLKNSRCSLSNGPDLDILESMANFGEPMDELVGPIVQLARRSRDQDQYLVACVHGLQGQVRNQAVQRLLVEHLRSNSSSCLLKSEIVLTLMNVMQQQLQQEESSNFTWPVVGTNKVDETLMDLVATSSGRKQSKSTPDAKCLSHLVAHYMEMKRSKVGEVSRKRGKSDNQPAARSMTRGQRRLKRAVPNENNFWDEAQCKRWSVNDPNETRLEMPSMQDELLEEIDDNSIASAMKKRARSGKLEMVSLPLIERENGTMPTSSQVEQSSAIRRRHKCTASKKFGPKNAEATLKAEIVNDLVGPKDENKFLARFRLGANFLGQRIDVGRMYLWHQQRTTRAHVNIMGKSLWDTSHGCQDQAPRHLQYMPLFDFNLWLVKVSVGLRLNSQMGFFTNCQARSLMSNQDSLLTPAIPTSSLLKSTAPSDQLELYPSMSVQASAEASAKFVVAKAGLSLAGQYGYQGSIRVSKQPESCMSVQSGHQPMNLTFASWFQLWDSDCHYWGSRLRGEPQATKWRLLARKPSIWLEDECLNGSPTSLRPPSSSNNITKQAISP